MKNYKIHFYNKLKNINNIILLNSNEFILNAAEKNNIKLPYSCRNGACSACVCRLIKGSIKHNNQSFLSLEELQNNYFLSCVAYATSDLTVLTHVEEDLF